MSKWAKVVAKEGFSMTQDASNSNIHSYNCGKMLTSLATPEV
jgi:hypothetical protein